MSKFAFALLTALAIAAPVPAAAEVIDQSEGFFVTRDSVSVKADPKAVWLALISPGKWWSDEHTWSGDSDNMSITPQGGGCFCEVIPEEDTPREVGLAGSVAHMTVVQAYPMKVLRMRGALGPLQSEPVEGIMTITLKAIPGGTQVVMEYVVGGRMRYPTAEIAAKVDEVLSEQLGGMVALLGAVEPAADAAATEGGPTTDEGEPKASGSVEDALDAMDAAKQPTATEPPRGSRESRAIRPVAGLRRRS